MMRSMFFVACLMCIPMFGAQRSASDMTTALISSPASLDLSGLVQSPSSPSQLSMASPPRAREEISAELVEREPRADERNCGACCRCGCGATVCAAVIAGWVLYVVPQSYDRTCVQFSVGSCNGCAPDSATSPYLSFRGEDNLPEQMHAMLTKRGCSTTSFVEKKVDAKNCPSDQGFPLYEAWYKTQCPPPLQELHQRVSSKSLQAAAQRQARIGKQRISESEQESRKRR
jgi:hypothetical protein